MDLTPMPASVPDAMQKNIEAINNNMATIQQLPQILQEHQLKTSKAIDTGMKILGVIQEKGMSDELLQASKEHIIACRDALVRLQDKRKPGTQAFTLIAKMFTALEGLIDITNKETPVNKLQLINNKYVADKIERERKEQEERDRIAKKKIEAGQVKADYERQIGTWLVNYIAKMKTLMQDSFNKITLADYASKAESLKTMDVTITVATIAGKMKLTTPMTMYHSPEEAHAIGQTVWTDFDWPKYYADYESQITDLRTKLISDMPGKKIELDRIASANAAEKERLEKEKLDREAEQKRKDEEYLKFQQSQVNAKADTTVQNTTVEALFDANKPAAATTVVASKTTTKLRVINHTGIVEVFTQWYKVHGHEWSLEDLTAKIKFMITDLEADARQPAGEKISSANVEYYQETTSSNRRPATKKD